MRFKGEEEDGLSHGAQAGDGALLHGAQSYGRFGCCEYSDHT